MPVYALPIKRKRTVAENTTEITLGLTGNNFSFTPGQYVRVVMPGLALSDAKGNGRDFSIASSPNDHETIAIAFRDSESSFKKSILAAPEGTMVEVHGPLGGIFALPDDVGTPIVCIAGGIGVTPFLSMVRYATQQHLPHKMILLYANHNEVSGAYVSDLQALESENSNFSMRQHFGHVDEALIQTALQSTPNALWYIAGPEEMTTATQKILTGLGVPPARVRVEEFSGYEDALRAPQQPETASAVASSTAPTSMQVMYENLPANMRALVKALNSGGVIISQTDIDGTIVYANDTFVEVSKYSREELIGQNHRILKSGFHPQSFYDDMWHNYLLKGEIWRGEIKNKAKDGTFYWVDGIIVPVLDKGTVTGHVGVRLVITDKKDLMEDVEHERNYYRALSENATDMVSVLREDGTIDYASPSFEFILGHNPDELKGKKIFELMHPDDLPVIGETFKKVIANPSVLHTVEFRFHHRDGSWRTMEAVGKNLLANQIIKGIVCNCRDISARKETDGKLKARTAELEGFSKLMVDRELRMVELKEELAALKEQMKQENNTHE